MCLVESIPVRHSLFKPDLSREARTIESHLLKTRWSLIQANTPKSDIKIRGNKLFVKGKLFGQADVSGFTPSTNTPVTGAPMDTNNPTTTPPTS